MGWCLHSSSDSDTGHCPCRVESVNAHHLDGTMQRPLFSVCLYFVMTVYFCRAGCSLSSLHFLWRCGWLVMECLQAPELRSNQPGTLVKSFAQAMVQGKGTPPTEVLKAFEELDLQANPVPGNEWGGFSDNDRGKDKCPSMPGTVPCNGSPCTKRQ